MSLIPVHQVKILVKSVKQIDFPSHKTFVPGVTEPAAHLPSQTPQRKPQALCINPFVNFLLLCRQHLRQRHQKARGGGGGGGGALQGEQAGAK